MLSDAGKEGYNEDGDNDGDAGNGRHRNSLRNHQEHGGSGLFPGPCGLRPRELAESSQTGDKQLLTGAAKNIGGEGQGDCNSPALLCAARSIIYGSATPGGLVFFFRFLFEHSWPEALQSLCDHEGEILRAKINMLRMAERASLVAQTINNSPVNAGDPGLTPGSERCPGERNGTPLRYSCLKNPMDRGAWRATVHGVAKSWT